MFFIHPPYHTTTHLKTPQTSHSGGVVRPQKNKHNEAAHFTFLRSTVLRDREFCSKGVSRSHTRQGSDWCLLATLHSDVSISADDPSYCSEDKSRRLIRVIQRGELVWSFPCLCFPMLPKARSRKEIVSPNELLVLPKRMNLVLRCLFFVFACSRSTGWIIDFKFLFVLY